MRQVIAVVVALGVVVSASPRAQVPAGQAWDATFRAMPKPDNIEATMKRLSARPHHVGSPYDKDNAEWIAGAVQGVGLGRADRDVRRAVSDAEGARCSRWSRRRDSRPSSRSRRSPDDPTSSQKTEQLPDLQRVLDRRRRDGAARLRQLRPARGLRRARPTRRLREGRDRHRALRRVVARHQAEGRGRARRDRLPHLLRSERRRLLRRADVFPTGPMRPKDGVQRGSVMDMPLYPGDPLTPGVGATPSAKRLAVKDAPTLTKIPVLPISYGDAQPLLAALTGRSRRTAGAARCRSPIASARAPARVHLKVAFNWDIEAALQRHRADCRAARSPTSGSCAATITTRGSTAPSDPVSGMSADARRGARARRAAQAGLDAEAHDRLRRLGRRRAGAARLDRVGRDARRRPAGARRRLHQHRRQRPRLPRRWADRTRSSTSSTTSRGTSPIPRPSVSVWKRAQAQAIVARRAGRRQGQAARPRGPADRRARLGLRLHAVPPARRRRVAQPRLRRRRRRRASTTRSTTTSTSTRTSSTPTSSTGARSRRRWAPR